MSLIELAVVILVFGVLMAMAVKLYGNFYQKTLLEKEYQTVRQINEAMNGYFAKNGWYPCPASFSARPGDPGYGLPTDCSDMSVPAGSCNADYCVASRTFDHDGDSATPDMTMRIRVGSLPFLFGTPLFANPDQADVSNGLGVSGHLALDPYGRRMTYALTERQGTLNYVDQQGAILILDEHGHPLDWTVDKP